MPVRDHEILFTKRAVVQAVQDPVTPLRSKAVRFRSGTCTGFAANQAPGVGRVYLGYGTGTLQAIAAPTGQPRWTRQLLASPADLVVGSSAVYALDQNGGVYAVQA
jgi:outer membrane protein assembly factor BamB